MPLISTAPAAPWLQPTLVIAVGSGDEPSSVNAEGSAGKGGNKPANEDKEEERGEALLPTSTSVAAFSREILSFNDIFPLAGMSVRGKEAGFAAESKKGEDGTDKDKGRERENKKLSKRQVRVLLRSNIPQHDPHIIRHTVLSKAAASSAARAPTEAA